MYIEMLVIITPTCGDSLPGSSAVGHRVGEVPPALLLPWVLHLVEGVNRRRGLRSGESGAAVEGGLDLRWRPWGT